MGFRRRTAADLLDELAHELDRGRIYEATIKDPAAHTEGYCDFDLRAIYIDPAVSVVDTLLHELLHRRYPRFSERRVRAETARVLSVMDHDDVRRWFRKYKRVAVKRRAVHYPEEHE